MLKKGWEAWKQLARRIGDFQARVLLTIIYVVIVTPFGLVVRLAMDPLRLKRRPTQWLDYTEAPADEGRSRRQG